MERRLFWVASLCVGLVGALGCSSRSNDDDDDTVGDGDADADGDGPCLDEDGDGAGVGDGCTADDCDDTDPGTTSECGSDCGAHPQRLGCPCADEGAVRPCYHGPEGTASQGACLAGLQRCEDGVLGECTGQRLPLPETCDELDEDCDGQVDDGVLNECGTCGACEAVCSGPDEGCDAFAPEEITNGIVVTPEGWLTLGAGMTSLHVIWPSSSGTGKVFRVDTRTFEIEGAYWTGPLHGNGDGFGGGDSPSRTAVDDFGNVVISNRAFSGQGSITKIAASEDDCADANGNGIVDTSRGWDDLLDFESHDDWDDECILWHTPVGNVNGTPRAVAIHSVTGLDGVPRDLGWVGLYSESKFVEFDVETGELTGVEAPTPGFTPYGSALDRDGWLWATGLSSIIGRFDTTDPDDTFETMALPANGQGYRVIVDENNTPWVSGNDLYRFNRDDEDWTPVGIVGGGFGFVGNVASDGEGSLWVGTYADGQHVYRVSNDDDLEFHQVATPGTATFGTAVDFDGHAWAFGYTDGTATAIDIEDESTTLVLNDCGGAGCLDYPYVRGDITGLQRRNALNPRGNWNRIVEGCDGDATTTWTRIVVDADTPAGATVTVSVKTADDLAQLPLLEWLLVGVVPADGNELSVETALAGAGVEHGRYLAVQLILASLDRAVSPVVRGVSTQYGCDGGFE